MTAPARLTFWHRYRRSRSYESGCWEWDWVTLVPHWIVGDDIQVRNFSSAAAAALLHPDLRFPRVVELEEVHWTKTLGDNNMIENCGIKEGGA